MTDVARRWQVCPQQLWGWRREAREGPLALPMEAACPPAAASFVPIVTEASPAVADAASGEPNAERIGKPLSAPVIEIRLAGAVVRVMAGDAAGGFPQRAARLSGAGGRGAVNAGGKMHRRAEQNCIRDDGRQALVRGAWLPVGHSSGGASGDLAPRSAR